MKYASQWALAAAALIVGSAYACAVPVEIQGCQPGATSPNCDVIVTPESEFGVDGGVTTGQGGSAGNGSAGNGSAGNGSANPPSGGSAGSSSPPSSGSAGANSPPPGGSAGTQGQAGSGQTAGAGGASGGSAGSGAGAGGAAGTGTAGTAGTTGAAGSAGTAAQSTFDPASCDFVDRAGCEEFACAAACPTGMGTYCTDSCPPIITCVAANPLCVTAQDPMCAVRNNGAMNTCTAEVEPAGGATTTDPNAPAFVARALVQCLCSDPRP